MEMSCVQSKGSRSEAAGMEPGPWRSPRSKGGGESGCALEIRASGCPEGGCAEPGQRFRDQRRDVEMETNATLRCASERWPWTPSVLSVICNSHSVGRFMI